MTTDSERIRSVHDMTVKLGAYCPDEKSPRAAWLCYFEAGFLMGMIWWSEKDLHLLWLGWLFAAVYLARGFYLWWRR